MLGFFFSVTHLFPRVYRLLFVACARSSPLLRGVRLDGLPGVDWDFFVTGERWACGDVFFVTHWFPRVYRLLFLACAQLPVGRENYQLASIRAKKKRAP